MKNLWNSLRECIGGAVKPKSIRHYGIAFCQKRRKVLTEEGELSDRE